MDLCPARCVPAVVAVIAVVSVTVCAQGPCTTPTNEPGTCRSISSCAHLAKLVESEPVPQETIRFLERLQCGISGLEPLVCCAAPKESAGMTTARPPSRAEPCRTPNGTEGACVPINECDPYYATIMNVRRSDEDSEYLRRSTCGEERGTVKLCCPNAPPPPETVSRSSDTCRTPSGQQGACVVIALCPPYKAISEDKPISRENVRLLLASQCGEQGRQPKLCCPIADSKLVDTKLEEKMDAIGANERVNLARLPDGDDCGKQEIGVKIRNGEKTGIYEFPWMALLKYSRSDDYQCGGVLISRRYVMTAAHCVSGTGFEAKFGRVKSVRLGEHNLNTDPDCFKPQPNVDECNETPQDVPVVEVVAHDGWTSQNKTSRHDIALLRLGRDVTLSVFVRPICLAKQRSAVANATYAFAAGWGTTELDLVNFSPEKLKIRIPITDRQSCTLAYRSAVQLSDGQFCAGGGNGTQNVCKGDSGGPLMVHNKKDGSWYSIGIISAGVLNCKVIGVPSIFTDVSYYLRWIVSNMKA